MENKKIANTNKKDLSVQQSRTERADSLRCCALSSRARSAILLPLKVINFNEKPVSIVRFGIFNI